MALLEFATAEVVPLIKHAKSCTKFVRKWNAEVERPGLLLVVDQGVFLMSNGLDDAYIRDTELPQTARVQAYANGKNPQNDPNWLHEMTKIFRGLNGIYHLDVIEAVDALIARGDEVMQLSVCDHQVSIFDSTAQSLLIGNTYTTPSGLGGTFHVKLLELTPTHALVQNDGNCEDFDEALPYRVPRDKLFPLQMKGAA